MATPSRGPTANQLQPPKRIQPDLLYSEDLEEMFGAEDAKKGVHLEIINVTGGTVSVDPAGKEKKKVIKLKLGDGNKILEKQLGLNQTNKKALIAAFDTEYVSEWVGWITLYVILVEDRKNGGMVPAIRIKNKRPELRPTFDYQANVRKRQEAAGAAAAKGGKAPPPQQPEPKTDDLGDKIARQMERTRAGAVAEPSDEERAAIEDAERQQFTAEPEEGEES